MWTSEIIHGLLNSVEGKQKLSNELPQSLFSMILFGSPGYLVKCYFFCKYYNTIIILTTKLNMIKPPFYKKKYFEVMIKKSQHDREILCFDVVKKELEYNKVIYGCFVKNYGIRYALALMLVMYFMIFCKYDGVSGSSVDHGLADSQGIVHRLSTDTCRLVIR